MGLLSANGVTGILCNDSEEVLAWNNCLPEEKNFIYTYVYVHTHTNTLILGRLSECKSGTTLLTIP